MTEARGHGRTRPRGALALTMAAGVVLAACDMEPGPAGDRPTADLILTGGQVWTGDPDQPTAEAVAIRGHRILAVGSDDEVRAHQEGATEEVPLDGRYVGPGFIDNHTHFNSAGSLLLGVNLLDVADEEGLVAEVEEAVERLPEGSWLDGGSWGAYEAWEAGDTGADAQEVDEPADPFTPHRDMIDPLTPEHPALLSRWDGEAYLANALALEEAGLTCDDAGVACENGEPTGMLSPEAASRVQEVIPSPPLEQRMEEARVALEDLAQHGVTTIHDNTPPQQLGIFHRLRERGELTSRVLARPTLNHVETYRDAGIPFGFGDRWIRTGAFKGFVDGIMGASTAMFYEPFEHTGGFGQWRNMMEPDGNLERLITEADEAGYWPNVHAIGDHAIDTLLTMYENVKEGREVDHDRRWRVIHAQHLRDADVADRMAELDLIAEMQPYHAIDDMRWMEERIGDRIRWTYAFRTLDEAGVTLSFGSDWPGTHASWYPSDPLEGMYAAVTRQTLDGEPEGGWVPEERIDAETALRAYTVNNAYAEGTEDEKGRVAPGLLADLVVLDAHPLEVDGSEIKDIQVDLTIVDGEVVYGR